jgi:hypothetical protein
MCLSNLRINAPQRISAHSPICKYPASSRIAIPAIARACAQVWSRATNLWKETETPRPASRRARSIANVTHRTEKADRIESRFRPLKTLINPTFFPQILANPRPLGGLGSPCKSVADLAASRLADS